MIAASRELDVLVNNMSIYDVKAFQDITDADWQTYFDTNVLSGVRLTRHFLPQMLAKNWGRVIFVSSESGINIPDEMIHYGFSKAAQLAIARGCAELTKGTAVTVNVRERPSGATRVVNPRSKRPAGAVKATDSRPGNCLT